MAIITKAFDVFYKRYPTGSSGTYVGNLTEFWFTASVLAGTVRVSHSFLNYPDDPTTTSTYITSRDSESLNNKFHRAIPWGSAAADMLWNCNVPSWSFTDGFAVPDAGEFPVSTYTQRSWTCNQLTSQSFHRQYYPGGSSKGVNTYSITSSWTAIDDKMRFNFSYITNRVGTGSLYPTYMGSGPITSAESPNPPHAYRITYPLLDQYSTSSIDGQYFDQAGGAQISQTAVSESMMSMSLFANDNTSTGLANMTRALKNKRLFFPTPYSGSGTVNGTDYWFSQFAGHRADEIFDENGGIYNVELTLKRNTRLTSLKLFPQTGSYLNIFIHNVVSNVPSSSQRVDGIEGWYPPPNNIVRIDQGTSPTMSFFDIQTGFAVEKFNFNVVQYGHPAQFCIEPSGSGNSFFGIIVDDISICKVGVTTDPSLIKPTSIGSTTQTNRRFLLGIEPPASPEDYHTD